MGDPIDLTDRLRHAREQIARDLERCGTTALAEHVRHAPGMTVLGRSALAGVDDETLAALGLLASAHAAPPAVALRLLDSVEAIVERRAHAPRAGALHKTTIVIWSRTDPGSVELLELARRATDGDAYCSRYDSRVVTEPERDEAWDGTDFFDESCPKAAANVAEGPPGRLEHPREPMGFGCGVCESCLVTGGNDEAFCGCPIAPEWACEADESTCAAGEDLAQDGPTGGERPAGDRATPVSADRDSLVVAERRGPDSGRRLPSAVSAVDDDPVDDGA